MSVLYATVAEAFERGAFVRHPNDVHTRWLSIEPSDARHEPATTWMLSDTEWREMVECVWQLLELLAGERT